MVGRAKESVNSDSFAGVRHMLRTVILGTLLVEGLAYEVERRGAVPFYGTAKAAGLSPSIASRASISGRAEFSSDWRALGQASLG